MFDHATLESMGRAALIHELRIVNHAGERGGHWSGPEAEQSGDTFLRQAAFHPRGAWTWTVRLEVVLETGEPLTAWQQFEAGKPSRTVRQVCAAYFTGLAEDQASLMPHRLEAHRVAELLSGSRMAGPEPPLKFYDLLHRVHERPGPRLIRSATAARQAAIQSLATPGA